MPLQFISTITPLELIAKILICGGSDMMRKTLSSGAKELFRYARVFPPRIIDLPSRVAILLKRESKARKSSSEKSADPVHDKAWAREFINSENYIRDLSELKLEVFNYLKINSIPQNRLPCRDCIEDDKGLAVYLKKSAAQIDKARNNVMISLYAAALAAEKEQIVELSRVLQFLDLLPQLSKTESRLPYAPAVVNRYRDKSIKITEGEAEPGVEDSTPKLDSNDILLIWDLSNEYLSWKKAQVKDEIDALKQETFCFLQPASKGKKKKELSKIEIREVRQEKYNSYIKNKKDKLKKLNAEYRSLSNKSVREHIDAIRSEKDFQKYMESKYGKEVIRYVDNIEPPVAGVDRFCELFSKQKEKETKPNSEKSRCIFSFGDPCIERLAADKPIVDGTEDVRPLGYAELVIVEENWLGYKPGEISSIENILKGEVRKKEVKSTKYFEELTERMTQETSEEETQTESRMKQDLSSQIETELTSRFNSDINANVSGSGGGNIGVVNFEGGASLASGLGLGLDTSISTSTESDFSQEIISRALERTKKVTSEFRRSRTYSLFETTNYHEIDNTGGNSIHTNGIYCFLDKEVCITERVYGIRKFLVAELLHPGNAIVEKERHKLLLNLNEAGRLPSFDLSPSDITPENYLALVGKYRASNVSPPPSSTKVVSKTYKTDTTNENREQNELSFKKVAEVLAPFFGKYKRFLIQDDIEIPEGYRVQEVKVTVTHGSNGVSIPAHLPFSLIGASLFAMPTMGASVIPPYTFFYLPIAIWQVMHTASPLLHYNADSSNVTINIGHHTEESPYFFFQPDILLTELVDALANSSVLSEDFINFIKESLETLYASMTATNNNELINALTNVSEETRTEINNFITNLQNWLGNLVTIVIPAMILNPGGGTSPTFPPIPSVNAGTIAKIPEAILAPFKTFFDSVVEHMEGIMTDVLGGIFEYFNTMLDNTDTKTFSGTKGFIKTLPVSFNCIALKPGITINLSACLVRIDELALDAWKLETYDRLNQAFYQMQADFESGRRLRSNQTSMRESPGLMRQEELEVIKDRIIHLLHRKYSADSQSGLSLQELRLFEHAIDWDNLSYRLFNYGPSGREVAFRKLGLYETADERRKKFMNALWSQVLIPLKEDNRLEQVMINYLDTGLVNFETDLLAAIAEESDEPLNELTLIYRDMILQRQLLPEVEPKNRKEILPTELIVIYESTDSAPYPINNIDCLAT